MEYKKPVWYWVLVYLVIGGVVYAGYYYYKPASYTYTLPSPSPIASPTIAPGVTSTTGTANPSVAPALVSLGDTGYSPSTLTISVGDTVTWANNGSKQGTVSSDPHPQHTDYPPLNLGMIKPGATASLTFDKPGTYTYHNHLNSGQKGTIIVK